MSGKMDKEGFSKYVDSYRRFNSDYKYLHYRIVYELMQEIVLLRDRIKELEKNNGNKKSID